MFRFFTKRNTKNSKKKLKFTIKESETSITSFQKSENFWSARVGIYYRAIAVKDDNDFIWVWIGTHGEYERLIN